MARGRDGHHIWEFMVYVLLAALLLAPAAPGVTVEPLRTLYVSFLLVGSMWTALWRVRVVFKPGSFRDWVVSPVLYCAPLALTVGLQHYAEALGLNTGQYGFSVMPAILLSGFAVVFVGPWFGLFKLWPVIGSTPTRRRLLALATGAGLVAAACYSPGESAMRLLFLGVGYFPACVVVYLLREDGANLPRPESWPVEVGYVPRADGDDPFA